jgi:3-oxoadipate enol-lactonase
MPTMTIDGVRHAYDDEGAGSPLLLIHAGIADRRMWDDLGSLLAPTYRVVRPDLRGFGDTEMPPAPFSYARDVAALLEHLGVGRAAVCGVSLGVGVALDLALGRPDLVDRLVLVSAGLPDWDWDPIMDTFDDAETAALEAGDLDGAASLNVRFWFDGPSREPDAVAGPLRDLVHTMQRRAFERHDPGAQPSWLVPDRYARLADVSVPTLVVVGDLDHADHLPIGRRIADTIPGARLEVVPGVAHLPPLEDPAAFARLVRQHLGDEPGPSPS